MNKEDYVSLDVAKLLKEKGFNEDCGAYYHLNWEDMTEEECFEVAPNHDFRNKDNVYRAGAPTLYEAAKWLRLNYSINIVVFFYSKELGYGATIQNIKDGKDIGEKVELFDTYEEALNAGILEALKLI